MKKKDSHESTQDDYLQIGRLYHIVRDAIYNQE
jgi:hypothetical protein